MYLLQSKREGTRRNVRTIFVTVEIDQELTTMWTTQAVIRHLVPSMSETLEQTCSMGIFFTGGKHCRGYAILRLINTNKTFGF